LEKDTLTAGEGARAGSPSTARHGCRAACPKASPPEGILPRRRGGGRRDDRCDSAQMKNRRPALPCRLKFTYAVGGRGRAGESQGEKKARETSTRGLPVPRSRDWRERAYAGAVPKANP